ncbi:MAG: peptidoglycan-associated lipoprotein [Desulfobulbaceae bacterium A2]|nr:MAG: peptidoglycan-associated lipoprotein [Desulfobulbaceae bacterium A2]
MIQYAPPESGRLDGPAVERLDQNGMDRFATKAGQDSDAYKRLHGRSSEVFLPIYFDFDQSSVRPDQKPTLEKNAQYLQSNPTARIVVEGNCDDRGTNEYNIALGERRAVSAKNYLVGLGISAQRVRTTSFGEERPLFMGTDEESYSLNRRDDFVLE